MGGDNLLLAIESCSGWILRSRGTVTGILDLLGSGHTVLHVLLGVENELPLLVLLPFRVDLDGRTFIFGRDAGDAGSEAGGGTTHRTRGILARLGEDVLDHLRGRLLLAAHLLLRGLG
jgi:hypothetical protein